MRSSSPSWRPVEHGNRLGELVQRLLARARQCIGAALDAVEPAVNIALQYRRGASNAGRYAQFGERHRSGRGECPGAAKRILAIGGDDRRSAAPTEVEITPPPLKLAKQQLHPALRLARVVGYRVFNDINRAAGADQEQAQTQSATQVANRLRIRPQSPRPRRSPRHRQVDQRA